MIINASRIGAQGTGLYNFTKSVIHCLSRSITDLSVLAAEIVDFGSQVPKQPMPAWVTMTPKVSFLRPILWYMYANIVIDKNISYVLGTTHHQIPGIKHQIITIHDLRLLYYPDNISQYFYFKVLLKKYLPKLDAIFTVSEETKRLIQKNYSFDPEKIFIIPNSVDMTVFKPATIRDQESEKYFLSVGATWRHKNIHEFIENSEVWADKYTLKILAGRGTYWKYLMDLVRKLRLIDRVEFLPYVSLETLVSLYQNATALVYPSKMEGFGIPPLEAMACGIPVVLSDFPVFRENFNDIPIYIYLNNKKSWANAISLLEDRLLMDGKIAAGIQKAGTYSEDNVCTCLLGALEKIWPEVILTHNNIE
jgi:glycosyltransferase involved in cell wall biosynthesis